MADDLEEVRQRFEADMAEYLADLDRGAKDARKFADANAEASAALAHERDEALATAAALGIYSDKMGRLHDANGQFVSSAKAAELGLTSFKDELKKASDTEKEADDQTRTLASRMDGLKSKLSGLFSGLPGANTKIPGLDSIPGIGGIASNPYGLAAVVGTVQALLPELTGLVSGFAAAGAGAGAFALLAKPAVTSVTTAYTNLNTAVTKYQAAQAKEAMAPSKSNATAVRNALTNVNLAGEAIQKLPASEQKAVDGLFRLTTEFHRLSTAFQPEAFKVFADVLKIANELLPHLTPFATSFADALDGVLKKTAGFADSKGFKDWLAQFQSLVGPSVTAIGEGIGKVAVAIGHLLTTMSAKDVVNSLNIAFTVLAGAVVVLTDAVRFSMMQWDALTTAFDTVRADAKAAGHEIASAFDVARHAAAVAGRDVAAAFGTARHDIAAHFDEIRHDTANLAHNIASYFDEVRANVHRWVSDVIGFVQSNWHLLIAIIAGPFGLIQDAISTHLKAIEGVVGAAWNVIRSVSQGAWDYIAGIVRQRVGAIEGVLAPFGTWVSSLFRATWNAVTGIFSWAFGSMRSTTSSGTSAIRGVLNWFGGLASMFRRWWNDAANAVFTAIVRMIGFVQSIPGRVNSALGNLPSMLFRAGANAIQGLINGMGSVVGAAMSTAASWGHDIVNALGSAFGIHFSEPSEAAKMIAAGARIPQGLAKGMAANLGPLLAAAQRVSAAATPGGYGAAGAPAGAGGSTAAGAPSVHVTVPITLGAGTQGYSDPRFLQFIQGVVQEATLRYTGVNPTNGLSLAGKL